VNFLAHLYLSDGQRDLILGNMIADFISPPMETGYAKGVIEGIRLHRQIDAFTDSHPVFRRSKSRISSRFRLLKGIMVDLFYDHFLARHWNAYHPLALEDFCEEHYQLLEAHTAQLPERLAYILPYMRSQNWLVSYRDVSGIQEAFRGLSRRISRKNNLAEGVSELRDNYPELEVDFLQFFPELQAFCREWRANGDQRIANSRER